MLLEFVSRLAREWIALLSGFASILIGLYERQKGKSITYGVFLAIAVFCVCVAFYRVWNSDVTELRKQVEAEKRDRPNLSLEVLNMATREVTGTNPDGSETAITEFGIQARVTNRGSDSVARSWRFEILGDPPIGVAKPFKIPDKWEFTFPEMGFTANIPAADGLYEKLENEPVKRGAAKAGWLRFKMAGRLASLVAKPRVRFRLSCVDVEGKTTEIEFPGTTNNAPSYVPGSTLEITPRLH